MDTSHLAQLLCDLREIKEKKITLYREASEQCGDTVGRDVFLLLTDAEARSIEAIKAGEEILSRRADRQALCAYIPERVSLGEALLKKVRQALRPSAEICSTVRVPVETGIQLEEEAIALLRRSLGEAKEEEEKRFIEAFIEEEKEHLRLLSDVKFYYEDPEAWLMEKGRAGLDGA